MRRLTAALLAAPLAAAAALAGCGSSPAQTGSNESVKVTGNEGKAPTVHIPARKADQALVTKTLVPGHGAKLTASESYLANFDVYLWRGKTNKLLFSSFTSTPEVLPVTMGLTGLQKALTGARVGARVLAVLPPKYGYGTQGNSQIGVKPSDTLVWVVDLLHAFPANATASGKHISNGGGSLPLVSAGPGGAPKISVPKTAPPGKLVVKTLIKGTGAPVKANQSIVVRYVGSIWRTGQVFNSNWPSATQPTVPPNVFKLGQLIPAWNTGLVGVPAGSRVMLVVPPAEGYGKKGNSQAGIKGTDTLVFVLDILATT
ncbi:MAG TPA: FKBP-type peptidyl-prolyl cis-trans isomerase [Streptosporangiaceae bacterium]|nr:FKBP-type peptidyl-prolyl cis-trans isomerase [Streptosporangiaceae bacterium]